MFILINAKLRSLKSFYNLDSPREVSTNTLTSLWLLLLIGAKQLPWSLLGPCWSDNGQTMGEEKGESLGWLLHLPKPILGTDQRLHHQTPVKLLKSRSPLTWPRGIRIADSPGKGGVNPMFRSP